LPKGPEALADDALEIATGGLDTQEVEYGSFSRRPPSLHHVEFAAS
jgi:hypothetical protein